jgi:VanZ family protein
MERLRKFSWRWGPAVAMMAVIYLASDTPSNDIPGFGPWDTLVKKGGHALGYGLLAAAVLRGLAPEAGRAAVGRAALTAWLLAGLYAVSDEIHQGFIPGRTPSAVDVVIDAAGAAAGLGVWIALRAWPGPARSR